MCHQSVRDFGDRILTWERVAGKTILEVGSLDINGSLREFCLQRGCKSYLGVDLEEGPGVDKIVDAITLVDEFGFCAFDIVIATELIEHTQNWQAVINNIKNVCKEGGFILVTTRSPGFPLHHPPDCWRFTADEFFNIFSDLDIKILAQDEQVPGVFIFAEKPNNFLNTDLSNIHPLKVEDQEEQNEP